jgi:hypothetical protein
VFLDKIVESKDSNDFSSSNLTLSRKDLEKKGTKLVLRVRTVSGFGLTPPGLTLSGVRPGQVMARLSSGLQLELGRVRVG